MTAGGRIRFNATVPIGGFVWRDVPFKTGELETVRCLTPKFASRFGVVSKSHQLFDHAVQAAEDLKRSEMFKRFLGDPPPYVIAALHRNFAVLESSEEAICAFANQYGHLGVPSTKRDGPIGEPFLWWEREQLAMSLAILMWDAIRVISDAAEREDRRHDAREALEGYLSRPKATQKTLRHFRKSKYLRSRPLVPRMSDDVDLNDAGSLRCTGLSYIAEAIDSRLALYCVGRATTVSHSRLTVELVPHNLLGALWLQFAQSIDGSQQFVACPCGTWMGLHPNSARTNKRYCTNSCKQKEARRRAAQAKPATAAGDLHSASGFASSHVPI